MKLQYLFFISILLLFGFSTHLSAQEFKEINGLILGEEDKKAISYSNIYIKGTYAGTVANSEGEFYIKVSVENFDKILVFSSLGFEALEIPIASFSEDSKEHKIYLKNTAYLLAAVEVPNSDLILREAIDKIPQNYPQEYSELTTFYRELVKKNKSYVDISQGILKVSKNPYTESKRQKKASQDRITVQKGHKISNYAKEDTLAFKVMGGPNTMMLLDIVKNPGSILGENHTSDYAYDFEGIQQIDGRRSYVLSFAQKGPEKLVIYEGTIYIDEKSFAIAGVTFSVPDHLLAIAGNELIQQKPSLAELTPMKLAYEVRYRESGGKWYLDYVRNEIEMKVNWRKKLFNSRFNATTELVVTDKKPLGGRISDLGAITASEKDLFSDQVNVLQETAYWEDFSIIRPEEDLKKAIRKIGKN